MVTIFHINEQKVYILSGSIVGILPDKVKKERAVVYCEDPLGPLLVDEGVNEAMVSWLCGSMAAGSEE